jgi:hypothetical protein
MPNPVVSLPLPNAMRKAQIKRNTLAITSQVQKTVPSPKDRYAETYTFPFSNTAFLNPRRQTRRSDLTSRSARPLVD